MHKHRLVVVGRKHRNQESSRPMKDSFDYFDKHPDAAKRRGMTKEEYEEYRMQVIMRNGNNGDHYDEPWDDGEYDDVE